MKDDQIRTDPAKPQPRIDTFHRISNKLQHLATPEAKCLHWQHQGHQVWSLCLVPILVFLRTSNNQDTRQIHRRPALIEPRHEQYRRFAVVYGGIQLSVLASLTGFRPTPCDSDLPRHITLRLLSSTLQCLQVGMGLEDGYGRTDSPHSTFSVHFQSP